MLSQIAEETPKRLVLKRVCEEDLKGSTRIKKKPRTDTSSLHDADSNEPITEVSRVSELQACSLTENFTEPCQNTITDKRNVAEASTQCLQSPEQVSIPYKKLARMESQLRCMRSQLQKKNKTIHSLRQVSFR